MSIIPHLREKCFLLLFAQTEIKNFSPKYCFPCHPPKWWLFSSYAPVLLLPFCPQVGLTFIAAS